MHIESDAGMATGLRAAGDLNILGSRLTRVK